MYDPITNKIIISRDVIFEEGGKWDWNLSATELKQNALAWGDDEAVTEEFEAEYTDSDVEESEYDRTKELPEAGQSSLEEQTRRERRKPSWMNNYGSGEGLSEEEEVEQNLAFYISHDDPVSFDEAVKEEKWQEAMKLEIQAIERNQTWELVSLPHQAKKIGVKWVYKTKIK